MPGPASSARENLPAMRRQRTPRAGSRQQPAFACPAARNAYMPPPEAPDVYALPTPELEVSQVEQIRKGMVVHSSDGERLGKVVAVRADTIIIEKGFFFPTAYTCRTSDIAEVRGEEVILRLARSQLEEAGSGTAQREVSEEERERNQPGSMPGGQGGMQRGQGGM